MAYAVNRSTISPTHANSIRTMLCLQPDTPNSKYNRNNVPEPILFYNIVGDTVHLPYLFAASLFQTTPNVDIPYPITQLEFTGTLRQNQIPVEQESWDQLERFGTSTLGLFPGFGKTILGAKLASRAKLMTVVLVHREILTTQWRKTFQDCTNARVWIVGEKNPPPICDVIICMDTRTHLIPQQMRDSIGFLIVDEAHAFCTPTHVSCLLAFHPKYIVIESASLERDDGMHSMIYALAGNHGVYRESNIPFSVMKIMTNTKPVRKHNRMGGVDWAALVQDTLMDQRRNQIILNLVRSNLDRKILILTSLRDHSTLLYDSLQQMGIPSDYLCGTKRGYTDSTVLVGTVSKIGTGFDPATSCPTYAGKPFDLLILACSIKKYSMLVQNVGRVFRAQFPTVMHLVDNDDIYKSHWYRARKWYIARGGTITDHNITNTEQPTLTTDNITQHQLSWAQNKANQLAGTTTGLTLNVIPSNPLLTIQANLRTVQPITQNDPPLTTMIPKVELTQHSLSMHVIPQLPLPPLSSPSPLIFGRRSTNDNDTTESPILSIKTEPTMRLAITPTLPVKTEPTMRLTIIPTEAMKTEPPVKRTITPTEAMKTEPSVKVAITPTETVKLAVRTPAIAITGQPLIFARKTCL